MHYMKADSYRKDYDILNSSKDYDILTLSRAKYNDVGQILEFMQLK